MTAFFSLSPSPNFFSTTRPDSPFIIGKKLIKQVLIRELEAQTADCRCQSLRQALGCTLAHSTYKNGHEDASCYFTVTELL